MVYRRSVKRRRESVANVSLIRQNSEVKTPRKKSTGHNPRRSLSADGIPRSRTSDLTAVRHPIHSLSSNNNHCRPQSALYSACPIHPSFAPILFHNETATNTRRRGSRDNRASLYELSQDLLDKQIELLEKKYGGRLHARHAALIIQRAYRRHSMQKKFNLLSSVNKASGAPYVPRTQSVYGTVDDKSGVSMAIPERLRPAMSRSTSATGRFYPQRIVEISPSTGLYDNLPVRIRCEAAPAHKTTTTKKLPENVPNKSLLNYTAGPSIPDGKVSTTRVHRSRQNAQSESPVRSVPSGGGIMTSTSCDVVRSEHSFDIITAQEIATINTSPVWKRIEEVVDRDSGLGSDAQLNSAPGYLDYDNVAPSSSFDKSAELVNSNVLLGSSLPPPMSGIFKRETSPRRNSETSRIMHTVTRQSQRRAVSASRLQQPKHPRIPEPERKRQYRVGLNLFNKKPEKGMEYLIEKGFVVETPAAVARFLISRPGLSKQKTGEYLGGQDAFSVATLRCFGDLVDLSGLEVDQALRKFQTYFRLPGEAQKIERVMEVFSGRFLHCNPVAERIFSDTITVLRVAYGVILLNTDLHNPSIKKERKMKLEDFLKNMRGALGAASLVDDQMLRDIYVRVKSEEFKPGNDHVSQVQRVDKQIIGDNKPVLPLPHRRLVCFCRLYEVYDENKKDRSSAHQREVFLFNDVMVVTKQNGGKKKNSPIIYRCRLSFPLAGSDVQQFSTAHHPNGLKLINKLSGKILVMFNARNDHDRDKFMEDLRESIAEMDEMEGLRIEAGLEKQQFAATVRNNADNRDSGLVEVEDNKSSSSAASSSPDQNSVKRTVVLSNSLLDMSEQQVFKAPPVMTRRLSTGSLDSGMCMPGSSSASTQSTPSSDGPTPTSKASKHSMFGSFFLRKSAKYQM